MSSSVNSLRERLLEIGSLIEAALADLDGGTGQAATDEERVISFIREGKPPSIAEIRKAFGCSQGKASKLRKIAVRFIASGAPSLPEQAERALATLTMPAAKVQADEPPLPSDPTPEGSALGSYRQAAKLFGWASAGPLTREQRPKLAAIVASEGLGGWMKRLQDASLHKDVRVTLDSLLEEAR